MRDIVKFGDWTGKLFLLHFFSESFLQLSCCGTPYTAMFPQQNVPVTDLNKVSSYELGFSGWDQVIQNLPPLPEAELHDISVDGWGVVCWREPCEKNTVLRAISCEAPWWSKKHQWFWGT